MIVFGYSILRAIRVRGALLLPFYRGQALWIGASGLYWVVFFFLTILASALQALGPTWNSALAQSGIAISMFADLLIGFVAFFAWIDNLAGIARDSDPRNNDILRWRELRLVIWGAIAIQIVWGTLFIAQPILSSISSPPIVKLIAFYAGNSPGFFLTSGLGSIALLAGSYRSKVVMIRRQLKWTGLYFLTLFANITVTVVFVAAGGVPNLNGIATDFFPFYVVVDSVLAFFLFEASRSLVKLGHLPEVGESQQPFEIQPPRSN
jgi:hypothetical protein